MTVLVGIPCLLTGGTEIQTLSLVQALVEAGHRVVVACYFEHAPAMVARYQDSGAEVRLLSPAGERSAGVAATVRHLWRGLRGVVREVRPDVSHVQYMAPGMIPILVLRALGVKSIVATVHTAADIYSPNGLRLIRLLNRRVLTAFQCITQRAERSFFGSSQLFSAEMPLRRRGNHFTIYNNLPAYMEVRGEPREFGDCGRLTIGVVSRLEHIKGMDLVVPAFAAVRREWPRLRLLVVGDGALRGEMERQVEELDLGEGVEFLGRQPQDALPGCYDRIDVLLMPSRSEGFGLTAVEGMARGCVVVAAATGGLPEVVRDGVDGVLCTPGSAASLAEKTLGLIASPQELSRLSRAAIARAATFSRSRYNTCISNLYQRLAGKSHAEKQRSRGLSDMDMDIDTDIDTDNTL